MGHLPLHYKFLKLEKLDETVGYTCVCVCLLKIAPYRGSIKLQCMKVPLSLYSSQYVRSLILQGKTQYLGSFNFYLFAFKWNYDFNMLKLFTFPFPWTLQRYCLHFFYILGHLLFYSVENTYTTFCDLSCKYFPKFKFVS